MVVVVIIIVIVVFVLSLGAKEVGGDDSDGFEYDDDDGTSSGYAWVTCAWTGDSKAQYNAVLQMDKRAQHIIVFIFW